MTDGVEMDNELERFRDVPARPLDYGHASRGGSAAWVAYHGDIRDDPLSSLPILGDPEFRAHFDLRVIRAWQGLIQFVAEFEGQSMMEVWPDVRGFQIGVHAWEGGRHRPRLLRPA